VGGGGFLGAFTLGLICGPIAAPCTGPFLTGILAWIAQVQSASLGALVMGTFALGLGVPFFLVGAFAMHLPKSGRWMLHVKSVLGLILCVVALYFLANAFPQLRLSHGVKPGWSYGLGGAALVIGLLLGAVHRSFQGLIEDKLAKGAGVVLAVGGAFLLLQAQLQPDATLTWHGHGPHAVGSVSALEEAKARAKKEGRPLLVDFTASWCAACKELEKLTFADDAVKREAGRFIAAKVDASDDEAPGVEEAMADYRVVGLPTVVLFDSKGREVRRFTDFVEAPRFVEALQEAQ
jgi:thiol:disulfide interchange protein DsbD